MIGVAVVDVATKYGASTKLYDVSLPVVVAAPENVAVLALREFVKTRSWKVGVAEVCMFCGRDSVIVPSASSVTVSWFVVPVIHELISVFVTIPEEFSESSLEAVRFPNVASPVIAMFVVVAFVDVAFVNVMFVPLTSPVPNVTA